MAFKPIDPKRDEFRRYLEHGGVIEALTKLFVRLIKERPENPLEYLHNNLGDFRLQADHEAFVRTELEEAKAEIQRLRSIIMKLDPTALEETKESDLAAAIPENAEQTTQSKSSQAETSQAKPENSIVHTEVESVVIHETVVATEVATQELEHENSKKDDNNAEVPSILEEKIDETPAKLEEKADETPATLDNKNNGASPQTDNKTDKVSAELSSSFVVGVAQSEDNNTDAATKSSDAIPQSEDEHINKETE